MKRLKIRTLKIRWKKCHKCKIIHPIEIDENNQVITGELRLRAVKLAELTTIPCKILRGLTPEQRLERQLVENFNRQDMRLVDSIEAVKVFLSYLKTTQPRTAQGIKSIQRECAKRLGISESWLSQNLKLDREAPKELKKALNEGKVSVSTATEIMKAPEEEREELTKEVLEESEIPEHRRIRERVKEKKQIKELKEKYEEGLKAEPEIQIIRATEIVNTYRSELNKFMQETQRAVYQIKTWKKMKYSWFDDKSKTDMNTLIKHTKDTIYKMLEEIEALEKSVRI